MAGTPWTAANFADFFFATGLANAHGPSKYIVDAVYRTWDWGRLAAGNVVGARRIQGGAAIQYQTILKNLGNFENFDPGAPITYNEIQTLSEGRAEWRRNRTHVSWTEDAIILNEAVTMGREEFVFQQFVDMRDKLNADLEVDMLKGLERTLWAVGAATMEGAGAGKVPASIHFHVNEETNGLPSGVTTKQGITPGDHVDDQGEVLAKPGLRRYTANTAGANGNILSALRRAFMDVEFQVPPDRTRYLEDPTLMKQLIKSSPEGVEIYMGLLAAGQDHWVAGPQDPAYNDPQFMGVPVSRSELFGNGAYYSGGDGKQFGATDKGPRYLILNGNYLFPVIHREKSFQKSMPRDQYEVPDRFSVVMTTYWNLICTSWRRQAVVAPSGSQYTA